MRSYLIEDLHDKEYEKITNAFKELGFSGSIEDIYYLPLPDALLNEEQKDHLEECGPYFMALESVWSPDAGTLKMELLVRGRQKIRCSCVCYPNPQQRDHMLNYLDDFIKDLGIYV